MHASLISGGFRRATLPLDAEPVPHPPELIDKASSFAGNLAGGLGYKPGDKIAMVLGETPNTKARQHCKSSLPGLTGACAPAPQEPTASSQLSSSLELPLPVSL